MKKKVMGNIVGFTLLVAVMLFGGRAEKPMAETGDMSVNAGEDATGGMELNRGQITGASLRLGQDLTMVYYVNLEEDFSLAENQQLVMRFTMNGKTMTVPLGEANGNGEFEFAFSGIAPQCMGDTIDASLVILGEDGSVLTTLATKSGYSVKANAEALLEEHADDAGLVQLVTDMLRYGVAAQSFKEYKMDAPVNANVAGIGTPSTFVPGRTDKALERSSAETAARFTAVGVWFDSVNKIYVDLNTTENVSLVVKEGETIIGTYTPETASFYTEAIYATDFDTVYTFELYEGEVLAQTLTYSVKSYVYSMKNSTNTQMADLAKALYCYGKSAENYKYVTTVGTAEELKAALNNSGAICLSSDVAIPQFESFVIPEGVTVFLDLNGHTISGQNGTTIYNHGDLTIWDSGTGGMVWNQSEIAVCNAERGALVISGGVIQTESTEYYVVMNLGELIVTGGTVTGDTGIYSGAGCVEILGGSVEGGSRAIDNDATLIVSGGSVSTRIVGNGEAFAITNRGTARITGGEIGGEGNYVIEQMGEMVITGGTVQGMTLDTNMGAIFNGGMLTISGGSISGSEMEIANYGSVLTITGGSFKHDPSEYLDGSQYVAEVQEDHMYKVVRKSGE